MFTPSQVARIKGLSRQGCDIMNIKSIDKRVGRSEMGSQTLLLAEARFDSQTLVIAGEQIKFQVLSNKPAGVGGAGNCRSCGNRVGIQTLSQAAGIVFLSF